MSLYKRGDTYHYDFGLNGRRYRGSTKAKTETRAKQVLKLLISAAQQGQLKEKGRMPRLIDFEPRFTKFITESSLDPDTKRYYRQGWAQLKETPLANMKLDRISREQADMVKFDGVSNAYANQARRTLRRMLSVAGEWNVITRVPRIRLAKDNERHAIIGPEEEAALLAHMTPTMRVAFLFIQDAGLRPEEVARVRIEQINWQTRMYFNAFGKSVKARRFVPLSDRLFDSLFVHVGARKEGWLLPSKRSKAGHVHQNSMSHWFTAARRDAKLPDSIVLYSARHTFATAALEATGNAIAVADAIGHSDVRMLRRYAHMQMANQIRDAINARNVTNTSQAKEKPEANPAKSLN